MHEIIFNKSKLTCAKIICNEYDLEQIKRVLTVFDFISSVRQWRASFPPEKQRAPKPYQMTGQPYCLDDTPTKD